MEKIHVKIRVTGKVQGVWYRGAAQRKARELGLSGFVKNEPDGSVYAEAEGPAAQIQALIVWCWQGPELAAVENVAAVEGEWAGFQTFEVRR